MQSACDNNTDHIDMDVVNRELAVMVHDTQNVKGFIDDIPGRMLREPKTRGELVLNHLGFLVDELKQNVDLVYTEDLTEHLLENYGKLIPNIHTMMVKNERDGFQRVVKFVGLDHPFCRMLAKCGYGVSYDKHTSTVKITVGHRWFYINLVKPGAW